jgi:hypothetical protein
MLTGFEAVAIDDCDLIALKPRGAFTAHVHDAWSSNSRKGLKPCNDREFPIALS